MKKIITMSLVAFALSGCLTRSAANKVGPDTYQISANAAPVRGGAAGAQSGAIAKANEYCASLGREIEVLNASTGWSFPANGTATVTFKCVATTK